MMDLAGKQILITGATNGIGRQMALGLADAGAQLHLVGRDRGRLDDVASAITQRRTDAVAGTYLADLSVIAEVNRVADEFLATASPLHMLINNAGAVFDQRQESADGIEMTLALNHLAYFALTLRLLPRLRESDEARVINTASDAYTMAKGPMNFDDLEARNAYGAFRQYAYSKLANILFTQRLARELEGTQISTQAFHPGLVATGFGHNGHALMKLSMWLLKPFSRKPGKGAETGLWLARQPASQLVNGGYYFDCKPQPLKPAATRQEDAERLWAWSLNALQQAQGAAAGSAAGSR